MRRLRARGSLLGSSCLTKQEQYGVDKRAGGMIRAYFVFSSSSRKAPGFMRGSKAR